MCKKDYSFNSSKYICDNNKYLESIVDKSVTLCDEIINVTDSVSTNVTNTIAEIVMSTVPINFDDKKVRYKMDCYILHTFLLVIILLFIIAIICYYFTKNGSKRKRIGTPTI